eukprot:scaffold585_cov77-Skeletonema_dohrnii-CCMP3373.AAC.2
MAQVGYWFSRPQSAGGAQSSVKLGRFSGQPARTNRLLFGVPTVPPGATSRSDPILLLCSSFERVRGRINERKENL